MKNRRTVSVMLLTMVTLLAGGSTIGYAQDDEPTEDVAADSAPATTAPVAVSSGAPFTARLDIDTRQPISYGDDVVVSVWITPHDSIDLEYVRIHAKGDLTAIYQTREEVPKDLADKATQDVEYSPGVSCRVSELNHGPGVPFVATCQLTSLRQGWRRWVDYNALLDSGQQRFEVEIGLQDGVHGTTTYYEVGTVDFVSPKSAVVLGGFLGSLIFSLLVFCIQPLSKPPALAGWKDLVVRVWGALPRSSIAALYAALDVVRRALLGGVTAMVLIILFKSSEGFETPISIHIQDFWGGLLVGLVSVHLAKWVLDKLDNWIK